jgi:hypothetical protein
MACGISEGSKAPVPLARYIPSLLWVGFVSISGMILGAGMVKVVTGSSEMAGVILGDWSSYSSIPLSKITGLTFAILLVPLITSFFLLFATWFAPPLIVLGNCSVLDGLLSSLRAARNNYQVFMLYGFIFGGSWVVYALLMYLVPGVLLIPIGQERFVGPAVTALSSLYWPIVSPIMLMSVYVGYTDIFDPEGPADK